MLIVVNHRAEVAREWGEAMWTSALEFRVAVCRSQEDYLSRLAVSSLNIARAQREAMEATGR